MTHGVATVILGGGRGTRLWPLTAERAKPAVPFGGKFRLIDIPISNSLHAGVSRIYVLTQYASATLHTHISQTYRFDHFGDGAVEILAAEESLDSQEWYQGTADAVRQNMHYIADRRPREVLILSGDQLYLMKVRRMVERHRELGADFSIAVKPVPRRLAGGLGVMRVDETGRIVAFVEKPQDEALLDEFELPDAVLTKLGIEPQRGLVLASMGIYLFRTGVLSDLLRLPGVDFGKEVIPRALSQFHVQAFAHTGYWADIGTIGAFHEASIALTHPLPPLNLYSRERPIYTNPRFLPGTKINRCDVERSILCEGSILSDSTIRHSIVGIRAIVREGAKIENSVVMGARFYETDAPEGAVPQGIGRDTVVKGAIVDLDARIGDGVRLVNEERVQHQDAPDGSWCIREGVIVVPRNASIPAGTVV